MKLDVLAPLAALSLAPAALAGILNVAAFEGNLGASARFEAVGTDLVITLSNIGGEVSDPTEVLTALFFDVSGAGLSLTPVSGVLAPGSVVWFDADGQPAGGVVGGEWAYLAGIAGPRGAAYGISSAGFDIFGQANFPGDNLHGATAVDGLNYGLLSAADDVTMGNAAVTGQVPLVQHSVVFTLSGLPAGFDPMASIHNVNFQYGTDLSEPNIPAPGAIPAALMVLSLAGRRRRRV